ncbi:hypothetical protein ACFL5O_04085 [Myxococcota bacterium]
MSERKPSGSWSPDPDALFCALVLVPGLFPRNRFFSLFEQPVFGAVRKRARRVRGVLDQFQGRGAPKAEVVGEQVMADGRVILRYRVADLAFEHTTALAPLEAAVLRYAMNREGGGPLSEDDRLLVVDCLRKLGEEAALLPEDLRLSLG